MNLTCEAVEDLYVLYQEDELHPSVKEAVDDHLKSCTKCTFLYESGDNFSPSEEIKRADKAIEPSAKLDQQIRLKLKLRRLKITFLLFITVLVIYSFFQYVDNRKTLLYEVSSLEQTVRELYFHMDMVKWEGEVHFSTSNLIENLNEKTTRIKRSLNIYENKQLEKHPYQLNLNFNLNSFTNLLYERYQSGEWSERDEQALNQMRGYLEDYGRVLTDERLKLNHVRDYQLTSLFKPFQIKKLKSIHQKIDQLGYTYSNFQQFPTDVSIMSEEELKQKAREVFKVPNAEVIITPKQKPVIVGGYGTYTTRINGEDEHYTAEWEAYTGRLLSFNNSLMSEQGEILPEEKVIELLQVYVPNLFGVDNFDYIDQGINYHFSSNVDHKLYTYRIMPMYDGYKTDAAYRLYIDARTGEMTSLISLEKEFYSHLSFGSSNIVVNKEEASDTAEKIYPTYTFEYVETVYIPSLLSNKYELVHKVEGVNKEDYTKTVLINANTGIEEHSY